MMQPKTAFTAATTSGRERKLSLRKMRRGTPSGAGGVGIAEVFFQEDRGVGQAETVDGLFHVAHHEEAAPLAGNRARMMRSCTRGGRPWYSSTITPSKRRDISRAARVGRPSASVSRRGGHVLQVSVVHQRAAALFPPRSACQKSSSSASSARMGPAVRARVAPAAWRCPRRRGPPACRRLFCSSRAGPLMKRGPSRPPNAPLKRPMRGEGHWQAGSRLVPAELALRGEAAQALRRVGEAGDIGLFQPLVAGAALYQRVHLPGPVEGRVLRRAHQLRAPGRVQRVRRQFGEQPGLPARPVLGPRVALQLVVEPQNELRQAAVVAPGAHGVRQGEEIRLRALIALLQRALRARWRAARLRGSSSATAKSGDTPASWANSRSTAAQKPWMVPICAPCTSAACRRSRFEPSRRARAPQRVGYARAQLGRGGLGEGDDKEGVDVRALLHQAQQPLGEHGASCRCPRRRRPVSPRPRPLSPASAPAWA